MNLLQFPTCASLLRLLMTDSELGVASKRVELVEGKEEGDPSIGGKFWGDWCGKGN